MLVLRWQRKGENTLNWYPSFVKSNVSVLYMKLQCQSTIQRDHESGYWVYVSSMCEMAQKTNTMEFILLAISKESLYQQISDKK